MADEERAAVTNPTKKRRYDSKYQEKWQQEYPWIRRSDRGVTFAFCSVCCIHISVSHGGKNDAEKHSKTSQHIQQVESRSSNKKINSFFPRAKDPLPHQVMNAETLFANFVAEHNLPFTVGDHFTKLVKVMFPDSQIAQKFACGRMKTTMVIKKALAPKVTAPVIKMCQTQPFSILIDESNDLGTDKNLVILVRLMDGTIGRAVTRFLDMPVCNIGTGASIFETLEKSLRYVENVTCVH
jgi:hypothetical protein